MLAGDNAITKWRTLMGPTKVFKTIFSHPESIRGQFGLTDTRNACHGSDSTKSARREIEIFFPEFDTNGWLMANADNDTAKGDTYRQSIKSSSQMCFGKYVLK